MEKSEIRRAGSLFTADARIVVCLKLAELEKHWDKAAGRAAARLCADITGGSRNALYERALELKNAG